MASLPIDDLLIEKFLADETNFLRSTASWNRSNNSIFYTFDNGNNLRLWPVKSFHICNLKMSEETWSRGIIEFPVIKFRRQHQS